MNPQDQPQQPQQPQPNPAPNTESPQNPQPNQFGAAPGPTVTPQQPQPQQPQPNPQMSQPVPQQQDPNGQPSKSTSTLAIVGFILAFILPLIGFILSIIALVQIRKKHQRGFALAIAGMIISVLNTIVLSLLILTTFSGVQMIARDNSREITVNSVHAQLESYAADNNHYPGSLEFLSSTGSFTQDDISELNYIAQPSGCMQCQSYQLSVELESGGQYTRESLGTGGFEPQFDTGPTTEMFN